MFRISAVRVSEPGGARQAGDDPAGRRAGRRLRSRPSRGWSTATRTCPRIPGRPCSACCASTATRPRRGVPGGPPTGRRRHDAAGPSRLLRASSCPACRRRCTSTACGRCSARPGTPTIGRPSLLDRLASGEADGAVLVLPEESAAELQRSRSTASPSWSWTRAPRFPTGIPVVCAAHSSGATQATRHLLSLGHRRIGVIGGPQAWVATQERLRGYHAALAGAGVLPTRPSSGTRTSASTAAAGKRRRCLTCRIRPPRSSRSTTAWRSASMQEAAARGLRVPGDLSVVGFDDTVEAAVVVPALTTVRQPLAEMGRTAVSLLLRQIQQPALRAAPYRDRDQAGAQGLDCSARYPPSPQSCGFAIDRPSTALLRYSRKYSGNFYYSSGSLLCAFTSPAAASRMRRSLAAVVGCVAGHRSRSPSRPPWSPAPRRRHRAPPPAPPPAGPRSPAASAPAPGSSSRRHPPGAPQQISSAAAGARPKDAALSPTWSPFRGPCGSPAELRRRSSTRFGRRWPKRRSSARCRCSSPTTSQAATARSTPAAARRARPTTRPGSPAFAQGIG